MEGANPGKSVVVGDSFFVAGFLYGGFDRGVVVKDRKDVKVKIDEIIGDEEVGLIVVSRALVKENMDYINRIKSDTSAPLIVEIDGYGKNHGILG